MKTWELKVMSDLVKIGVQEEEGYDIIRERWYVVAENLAGARYAYHGMEDKHEAEERLALLILDGGVDPITSDGWDEMYPVYGSLEYQAQEPEIVAAERRDMIEDTAKTIGMSYRKRDEVLA